MLMQVLVANMDVSVQVEAGGLIATAYECDYERPCNDDDLKYYEGCEEVEVPETTQFQPELFGQSDDLDNPGDAMVASVKSYKEYYESKRDEKEQLDKVQIGSHNSKELVEKVKKFIKDRAYIFAPHCKAIINLNINKGLFIYLSLS